MREEFIAR